MVCYFNLALNVVQLHYEANLNDWIISEICNRQSVTLLLFLECKKNDKFYCTSRVYSG